MQTRLGLLPRRGMEVLLPGVRIGGEVSRTLVVSGGPTQPALDRAPGTAADAQHRLDQHADLIIGEFVRVTGDRSRGDDHVAAQKGVCRAGNWVSANSILVAGAFNRRPPRSDGVTQNW